MSNDQTPEQQNTDQDQQMVDLAEVEDTKLEEKSKHSYSQGQLIRRRFFHHKPAIISLIMLGAVIILAFSSIGFGAVPGWWDKHYQATGSIVDGGRPMMFQDGNFLGEHPFGQENVGRDYFAMVMRGAQQSLIVAFVTAVVSSIIGIALGAIAGYFRGWTESIIMRLTDFVIVVPTLVFAAMLGHIAGGSVVMLGVLLGCATWTGMCRLVRAEVLSIREKEYVSAAVAMGASPARIITKHMIPNSIGVIIVNATFAFVTAILLETTLSYLGMGVQRPEVSLGLLIEQYQNAFSTRPWLFWFPGLFIIIIALAGNFIGDGLRDAFDPRQRRSGDSRPSIAGVLGLRGVQRAFRPKSDVGMPAAGGSGGAQLPAGQNDPHGDAKRFGRKK
ncbi:ABC transporter permease [Nesterenkonia sp. MY13]|uniref:ABC transporter permease n=1 Tax=Nesterenkonia sedimenti TaxID=1463632 RepID=A0A7X8TKW1_9MICC|nr:ABC transporter permease [Nesterenkonia sedimenti]NLS10662.1 ABC transporter permease [Nesterenkonia sedimenti]